MKNATDQALNSEQVLSKHWNNRIPVDPIFIAKSMGASVYSSRSIDYCGELLVQENTPTILYKSSDNSRQDRFIIAHELGHFVLCHKNTHKDMISSFEIDNLDTDEQDANRFAIEVLTPESCIRFAIHKAGLTSVEKLCDYFDVFGAAMRVRLQSLGVI